MASISGRAACAAGVAAGTAAMSAAALLGDVGAEAAPSHAERFRGGLPRACRDRRGRFVNPWLSPEGKDPCERGAGDVYRLMREWHGARSLGAPADSLATGEARLSSARPVDWGEVRAAVSRAGDPDDAVLAVWLGHASVLCVVSGRLILCDPVFSQRCSPFSFVGPLRLVECPVDAGLAHWPEDLAPDVVAVSHAHYDHLDEATVLALRRRFPDTKWVAPLGLGAWFKDRGIEVSAEMDWWQEDAHVLGDGLSLVCLPAQHWANRWPWDRNTTLWCGYGVVDGRARSRDGRRKMPYCFVGDTGYCGVFAQIGALFDVGLAAVPIGAYEPRWFMSAQHCDPAEAVQITADLGADAGLAVHWGTFPLTAETSARQLGELREARVADGRLCALQIGGSLRCSGGVARATDGDALL